MERFLNFLQNAKQALNNFHTYKTIHIVIGNESCDLDSTISALSLAYLIQAQKSNNDLVIPIMNTEAKYFSLRTEICYLLKKYGIDYNIFVFKNEIDYSALVKTHKIETSLVDHHVLSHHDKVLENTVVQIFDHRAINTREICKNNCLSKTVIKIVGSCATLIANELISFKLPILFEELSQLLYATIIYDTIGLNKEFGKTFDDDIEAALHLENILKIPQNKRKELFDLLWKIHNDTSSINTKDLLYRDLKVVKGIPIPGLPMLASDYLNREDADSALASFSSEYDDSSIVIIGIDANGGEIKRDIAIFTTNFQFKDTFINILKTSGSPLSLIEMPTNHKNISYFKQANIKLTRKFILPLVNEAASKCQN